MTTKQQSRKTSTTAMDEQSIQAADQLIEIGKLFFQKNWVLGTSGNFSVLLNRKPFQLLITSSGRNKGELTGADFVVVDETGSANDSEQGKPSLETLLHVVLAKLPDVGSVLHTHSACSTVLSMRNFSSGSIEISGYEMLKGLKGITTHDTTVRVKIFDNTQDMARLADDLSKAIARKEPDVSHAFLIKGHGLYTWGKNPMEARRHVEILEFLFEVLSKG